MEEWQLAEIDTEIADLDQGAVVPHDKVSKWMKSWGKPGELKWPEKL
jgi:predicted transcriptional regulator